MLFDAWHFVSIFKHNAWDHVEWSDTQKTDADKKISKHKEAFLKNSETENILDNGEEPFSIAWDKFYANHNDKFFKDRHWLFTEFPDLAKENIRVLEIGCGVGNTVIPLLDKNPSAFVYGCDYADSAIEILKNHPSVVDTDSNRWRIWQQDIRQEIPEDIIETGSLDIIVSKKYQTLMYLLLILNKQLIY